MSDLDQLLAKYVRKIDGGVALGPYGTLRFNFFLDILSAVHRLPDLAALSRAMADLIKANVPEPDYRIAAAKRGNTILGFEVARLLKKPSMVVRDEIIFGRYIEGIAPRQQQVIIVDDVSSDGELLREVVQSLRIEGILVRKAFVVVERAEGDARSVLSKEDVELISLMHIDDQGLERLLSGD